MLKTLVVLAGIGFTIIGIVFFAVGIYGIAGGMGITFTINDGLVTAQEGGQTFLVIGAVILVLGVGLNYLGFKRLH